MYILNPTKETVRRLCGGQEIAFRPGVITEVSEEVGRFILEPRGELVPAPQGATTWYGLVPITHEDKIEVVAKQGLNNWQRLVEFRLSTFEARIKELDPLKEPLAIRAVERDPRKAEAEEHLQWIEAVLAGEEAWNGKAQAPKVAPPKLPQGAEIQQGL